MQQNYLKLLRQIQTIARFTPDQLREFMGGLLAKEGLRPASLKVLAACADKITNGDLLKKLSHNFVNRASVETAERICENCTSAKHFGPICSSWNDTIEQQMRTILEANLSGGGDFDRLLSIVLNNQGINGLRKLLSAFEIVRLETEGSSFGNKEIVLKPDFPAIGKALQAQNEDEFTRLIESAFTTKSAATV